MKPKETNSMRSRAEQYLQHCQEYTAKYERDKLLDNWEKKEKDANAIVEDFHRRAVDPKGKRILEIGFGSGAQMAAFAQAGADVSGVEVNKELYAIAVKYLEEKQRKANIVLYDGTELPFNDASFDCVYSISVLEHVTDPEFLLREADRVLVPGGVFYLAFPNRLWPKETHSGFWFVSYLPRIVAEMILRFFGRNTIRELNLHFISYRKLQNLLNKTSLSVRLETEKGSLPKRIVKNIFAVLKMHHSAILPHIMVVLEKRHGK